jgi:Flp pilus assembly protein TadG
MQRLRDERGAVGVMVALLMVPLIAFAAISIDVGAMWAERQQLQNGADAGALAVAQDCARGECGAPARTAQDLATANSRGAAVSANTVDVRADQVSVGTSSTVKHLFAPVLGIRSSTLSAHATASWGAPSGGTALLPIAVSWCDFQAQTGGGVPTSSSTSTIAWPTEPGTPCVGPDGAAVPTGYRWLSGSGGSCRATSSTASGFRSSGDGSAPSGCGPGDVAALRDRTVIVPVFDSFSGTGVDGSYGIYGYAAFTITGYQFGGQYSWGSSCSGADRCLQGHFTRFVDLSDEFHSSSGAPQLGADVVSLTQ